MTFRSVRAVGTAIIVLALLGNAALTEAAEANLWADRANAVAAAANRISRLLPPPVPLSNRLVVPLGASAGGTIMSAVPAGAGTWRRRKGPEKAGARTVALIQDVHLNPEAQGNIAAAVAGLLRERAVSLVLLEGRFDALDLSSFRRSHDADLISEAAAFLVRQNKISGAVSAALSAAVNAAAAIGIDDRAHYDANVAAFRNARPKQDALVAWVAAAQTQVGRAMVVTGNAALTSYAAVAQRFHAGQAGLGEYAAVLASSGASLPAPLAKFQEAYALERGLDFSRVERQRTAVLDHLARALPPAALEKLLAQATALRFGQMRLAPFYAELSTLCRANGIDLAAYPDFARYCDYVGRADALDPEGVLASLDAAEDAAVRRLARTVAERRLTDDARRLSTLDRLATFSLSPREWASLKLPRGAWWKPYSVVAPPSLDAFENFYREADARDGLMTANVLRALEKTGATTAAVVVGGYHAEGLSSRLAAAGVSTILFTPRLTAADPTKGSAYLNAFLQEKTPLESLFTGKRLFVTPDPAAGLVELPGLTLGLKSLRGQEIVDPTAEYLDLSPRSGATSVEVTPAGDTARSVDVEAAGKTVRQNVAVDAKGALSDSSSAESSGGLHVLHNLIFPGAPLAADVPPAPADERDFSALAAPSAEGLAGDLRRILEDLNFDGANQAMRRTLAPGDYELSPYPVQRRDLASALRALPANETFTARQKDAIDFFLLGDSVSPETLGRIFGDAAARIDDFRAAGLIASDADGRLRLNDLTLSSKALPNGEIIYILADTPRAAASYRSPIRVYVAEDSYILMDRLQALTGVQGAVAETGSGSGIQLINVLKMFPGVSRAAGLEIDARARNVSRFNALLNGVGDRMAIYATPEALSDGLAGEKITLAFSNPPFIPIPEFAEVPRAAAEAVQDRIPVLVDPAGGPTARVNLRDMWIRAGWGGTDGLTVTGLFLDILAPLMAPNGRIVIYSTFAGDGAGSRPMVDRVGAKGWSVVMEPLTSPAFPRTMRVGGWPGAALRLEGYVKVARLIAQNPALDAAPYKNFLLTHVAPAIDRAYAAAGITHFREGFAVIDVGANPDTGAAMTNGLTYRFARFLLPLLGLAYTPRRAELLVAWWFELITLQSLLPVIFPLFLHDNRNPDGTLNTRSLVTRLIGHSVSLLVIALPFILFPDVNFWWNLSAGLGLHAAFHFLQNLLFHGRSPANEAGRVLARTLIARMAGRTPSAADSVKLSRELLNGFTPDGVEAAVTGPAALSAEQARRAEKMRTDLSELAAGFWAEDRAMGGRLAARRADIPTLFQIATVGQTVAANDALSAAEDGVTGPVGRLVLVDQNTFDALSAKPGALEAYLRLGLARHGARTEALVIAATPEIRAAVEPFVTSLLAEGRRPNAATVSGALITAAAAFSSGDAVDPRAVVDMAALRADESVNALLARTAAASIFVSKSHLRATGLDAWRMAVLIEIEESLLNATIVPLNERLRQAVLVAIMA